MPRLLSGPSLFICTLTGLGFAMLSGCAGPLLRRPASEKTAQAEFELPQNNPSEDRVRLVGDMTVPWGLNWLHVEGVALVTQLAGTGSDPAPSFFREKLIKEMQTHDVRYYTKALASEDTAMVTVQGYIPPGARKDDTFDVEVRVPERAETTSLRGGWLMQSRLRELRLLDTVREGHVAALSGGSILIDAIFEGDDDPVAQKRGRIPGGGVVQRSRPLGLAIVSEHSSVRTSAMIGAAINARFHHFDRGTKKGVANPKQDDLVELAIHPRYRHNLGRYLRVVRGIAVGETPAERVTRLSTLGRMLLDPATAELASLQLEAIGSESRTVLLEGLRAADPEVVFYSAEALAYLDQPEAAGPLRNAAQSERAFRWRALAALAAMETYEAQEALASLMHLPSAETRYGAFRALRLRNPRDPLVSYEVLNDEFAYHRIPSTAEPLLHFSRTRRPELVVFGSNIRLKPPNFFYAGDSILIKAVDDETLQLSCFRPDEEDRYEQCSLLLDDVIHAIAALGGSYGDVFDGLMTAKQRGFLDARIEVDALPRSDRRYARAEPETDASSDIHVAHPVPEMFLDHPGAQNESGGSDSGGNSAEIAPAENEATEVSVFDKLRSWVTY